MPETDQKSPGSAAATSVNAAEPLSIGEVLTVLTEEFPDVTISKIRFLESQGLVEPERNASGYRQFRDADIERLRWILRQQRDHFLPLKVIRRALEKGVDVIDAGAGDQPTLWTAVAEAAAADEVERKRAETVDSEAVDARRSAAISASHPTRARSSIPAGSGSVRRRKKDQDGPRYSTPADVVAALQEAPGGLAEGEPAPEHSRFEGQPTSEEQAADDPDDSTEDPGSSSGTTTDAIALGSGDVRASEMQVDESAEVEAQRDADDPESDASAPADDLDPSDRDAHDGDGQGAPSGSTNHQRAPRSETEGAMRQLSRDELIDEVGLSGEILDALEEFGLLDPVDVAGEATYGGRDVEIARLAKRGAELGLTPRHLRIYKVAADREAGLLEQVAMPLLKQRNPTSRTRATETVAELTELGASLHAALLAGELGPNLAP